jgi:hypothetical protein
MIPIDQGKGAAFLEGGFPKTTLVVQSFRSKFFKNI